MAPAVGYAEASSDIEKATVSVKKEIRGRTGQALEAVLAGAIPGEVPGGKKEYSEAEVKAVGATHFLTKPIDFLRLNLALAQANIQSVMARNTLAASQNSNQIARKSQK